MTIPFNTEPRTLLDCEWVGCRNHGEYIMFFGCLNEHTQENVICHGHYKGWMEFVHSMICGDCYEHIDGETVQFLHMRDVRPTNLTELLRDQRARIVARQFQDTFGNSYSPGVGYSNKYPQRTPKAPLLPPATPVPTPWPSDPQWAPRLPEGIMGVKKSVEETEKKIQKITDETKRIEKQLKGDKKWWDEKKWWRRSNATGA